MRIVFKPAPKQGKDKKKGAQRRDLQYFPLLQVLQAGGTRHNKPYEGASLTRRKPHEAAFGQQFVFPATLPQFSDWNFS